ncbi:uncharacterized protein LOC111104650 [Crassostrea virginica]
MSDSCYIACSRPDWPLADRIEECVAAGHSDATVLRSVGYSIHYQTVRSQILDCRHIIAIVTAEFIRHDLHLYELSYALDLRKRVNVVRHPSVELPPPFPARLGSLEWHQDPDILAQTEKSQGKDYSYDSEVIKRFIWKYEETQIADQLSPHVKSVEYARTELQLVDIKTTLVTLCEGINNIQNSQIRRRKVSRRQFPCDIRRVARRYQDVIAYPIIRQLGRYLDLEEDELDEVETFSEFGTKEVFWQTIRFWVEKTDSSELAEGTIIKALRECDVNLQGKQMPNVHRKILKSKMSFFVENIQVEQLIPSLVSYNVLCDVTKTYVSAPKTRDQRIYRLVDILMTKDEGLIVFCQALREAGFQFVADDISASLDQIQSKDKPVAVLRPSSFSQSSASTSDTESYVKQLIDRHRLSKCSSTSSVFSRRDSTSSTKVAVITPSVASDSCCTEKDTSVGTEKMKNPNSKNKKIDKKNSKKGHVNTGHVSAKLRKKEKKTSSLNCVSGCMIS